MQEAITATPTENTDVLIVGAGPTGMTAALALHQLGRKVMLIDKHTTGLDFSRALLINSESLAILGKLGVKESIVARGSAVNGVQIFDGNTCILYAPIASDGIDAANSNSQADASVDAGTAASQELPIQLPILLPQLVTEQCMQEQLATVGISIERPCTLQSFTQDASGVTVLLQQEHGQQGHDVSHITPRCVRANYVIGADGFHSATRTLVGIDYPTVDLPQPVWGVDVTIDHWPFKADLVLRREANAMMVLFRLGEHFARYMVTDNDPATRALAREWLGGKTTTWESAFTVHFATASEYGRGRVWLAGDAAHVHSPLGGRGMNMGIVDAYALAQALVAGDFASYAQERHAVANEWVNLNRKLTTLVTDQHLWARTARYALFGLLRVAGKVQPVAVGKTLVSKMMGVAL